LIGNNSLSNNILIPNVTPFKDIEGVETKDKGELSYRELTEAFKSYGKPIAIIIRKVLAS